MEIKKKFEIVKELSNRIEKDYKDFENKYLNETKDILFNESYKITVVQTFYDTFYDMINYFETDNDDIVNEDYFEDFIIDYDLVNKLIKFDKNILNELFTFWLNIHHKERYNIFEDYNTTIDIIEDFAINLGKKGE